MKEKVIWITGASSGIGEALAYELDKLSNRIILSARRRKELERVQSRLQNPSIVLPLDVTSSEQIKNAQKQAISAFGHIDILINNAGISQRSLVVDTSMEVNRKLFEVNFFGNIEVTKSVLPHFISRRSGQIVVISSVAGKLSTPQRSAYAATKHALHGWYDALWAEMQEKGVKVNMICPGYVRTQISVNALTGDGSQHQQMDQNQEKGLDPTDCAKKIIRCMDQNKIESYIGGKEVWGVTIRRFFPSLYYRIIKGMAQK